jgi:hypothetical protein
VFSDKFKQIVAQGEIIEGGAVWRLPVVALIGNVNRKFFGQLFSNGNPIVGDSKNAMQNNYRMAFTVVAIKQLHNELV